MMRRSLMLCAAAGFLAAGLFTSPAHAYYRVIKSKLPPHICWVWNYSVPTKPVGPYWIMSKKKYATFEAAWKFEEWLWHHGLCPHP
jgi:hypothetical protein